MSVFYWLDRFGCAAGPHRMAWLESDDGGCQLVTPPLATGSGGSGRPGAIPVSWTTMPASNGSHSSPTRQSRVALTAAAAGTPRCSSASAMLTSTKPVSYTHLRAHETDSYL